MFIWVRVGFVYVQFSASCHIKTYSPFVYDLIFLNFLSFPSKIFEGTKINPSNCFNQEDV